MQYIIIHHSAGGGTVADINNWHKQRGFPKSELGYYVGYHYVIEKNGITIQTRLNDEIGCHTIGHNHNIGICLIGNFEAERPTLEQYNSLWLLLDYLNKDVYVHQDFAATLCPGKHLREKIAIYKLKNKIFYLLNFITFGLVGYLWEVRRER